MISDEDYSQHKITQPTFRWKTATGKYIYLALSIILILILNIVQTSATHAFEEVEEVLGPHGYIMPTREKEKYEYGFLPISERNIWSKKRQLQDTMELLFPNRTKTIHHPSSYGSDDYHLRKLGVKKVPYDPQKPVECVKCEKLEVCQILNTKQIQEVYYPDNLEYKETCNVIEALGTRVSLEIFGNGRTFRDTPQCRDIVMQYLCLFYGSDNPMYTNYCVYQEDVTLANKEDHRLAPRPPCKSFCVQVVTVCANEADLIGTCNEIKCPPAEDECTPDPKIGTQVLDARLLCSVPYDKNPYFKSTATRSKSPMYLTV